MLKFLRRFLKEEEDEQVRLREKFDIFRRLLDANNRALEIMADMEEKLYGDFLFDTGYLFTQAGQLGSRVSEIVRDLNLLTQDRYPELGPICQRLEDEIQQEITAVPTIPDTPYILPLSAITRETAPAVGSKMANLGEIRNRLGLTVPRGFVIAASAYKRFMEASSLAVDLETRLSQARIEDLESLEAVSRELQALVHQAPLPPDLGILLREAGQALPSPWLAVRSSAVGEDTEFSFAGQFATLLNVDAARLPEHYQEIVASKFTSKAIFYWKYQHFSANELPMAVGCLAMVPARASGVMFSLDPQAPEGNSVIITAVWGLGKYAVDGRIAPDFYEVAREAGQAVKQRRISNKTVALICRPEGGVEEITLPPEQAQAPVLTEAQIKALAATAIRLEEHFGRPQDIEWALDERGDLVILQSRPLKFAAPLFGAGSRERPEPTVPPLLNFGIRAVGGAAAGIVYHFRQNQDLADIPPGAVLVTRQPRARLVQVMDRIAAIITEAGSPTDHTSILAREFRVPTLVEVGGALRTLAPGQIVTVDADTAMIYPGVIPELLQRREQPDEELHRAPVFQKLRHILKLAAPLNLIDPESPDFQARNCRTLHDITRFCHEKAMDAMFSQEVERALESKNISRLKTDLPLNLYILDLGGGLRVTGQATIEEEDIVSRPFKALLRGFHHPGVSWAGQVAPDLKGFISVFANTMYDVAKSERGLGGKSFAIVTENYLNFNSRLGYHFGLVDAYISEEKNDNYISFQFKGGAASLERRERRARLLRQILEELGFTPQVRGDLVQGRLVKYSLLETEETMEMVGLLMAFCRQLDLALASEAVMARCFEAFKKADYGLNCLRAGG